jgi:uncharacterized protein YheU (UPF0270 family)
MVIPPQSLSPDALLAVLEEFISREGTDYGDQEWTLAEKVQQLKPQVLRGHVLIIFDPVAELVTLIPKDEWRDPA